MNVVDEVNKIKKKEQELYKFILQQFLDLEEFKKSFSSSIAKTVDTKLEQIDKVLATGGSDLETIKKVILENLHLLRGEKGEQGDQVFGKWKHGRDQQARTVVDFIHHGVGQAAGVFVGKQLWVDP